MNIEYRLATPYVVMCIWVTREEIPNELPPLIGKVYHWLKEKQTEPAGPPFFEYRVMTGGKCHVCVGFPLRKAVEGDDTVHAGAFPEGEYATSTHIGPYAALPGANMALNEWFQMLGYSQRFLENSDSVYSGSRAEFYLSDPKTETDPKKWRTDIAVWVKRS